MCFCVFIVNGKMVSSPCQCPGVAGKVYNCFLPVRDNADDRCSDCHDGTDKL